MSTTPFLLIDYSSIGHAVFHISGNEPDPSFIATTIVARIRALAADYPHAALCCDSGKSFRRDLEPTYKAQRDTENRAVLKVQMDVALERLKTEDGFPVWGADTFEGDDVIATAVREILALDDEAHIHIATADKDMFQLVTDRVSVKRTIDKGGAFTPSGAVVTPAMVFEKYKVRPDQMLDFLALVGDASDNIKGADGIGEKNAAELLAKHGTLDAIYAAFDAGATPHITPAKRTALQNFRPRAELVRDLIRLRDDVPGLAIAEIGVEREGRPMEQEYPAEQSMSAFVEEDARERELFREAMHKASAPIAGDTPTVVPSASDTQRDRALSGGAESPTPEQIARALNAPLSQAVERAGLPRQDLVLAPRDYSQELEPRNIDEAKKLAQMMFDSRLFSAYGTPQAVLSTVLAGRELGLPAMASLRAFHVIEGKPQLSAGAIVSLVLKSGKAAYFRCTERTDTRATYCTKRGDDPEMCLSYTIEEAKVAWPKDQSAWNKSGWGRNPADMLVARASSKLARLVYPDVVSGLYAPEEMD